MIDEEDEYNVDMNNVQAIKFDKLKIIDMNDDKSNFEKSQDKSADNYSDTFEKFSETYKTKKKTEVNRSGYDNYVQNENIKVESTYKPDNSRDYEKSYDKFDDTNIKYNRLQNELLDQKENNNKIKTELVKNQLNSHDVINELNELKYKLSVNTSITENKDKTVEECKNQLTKANELIHQYRMALEDAFKQVDSLENVNKILKDEVIFLKNELEQNTNFKDERENNLDFYEAQRREKDLERKHNSELNDKDRIISKLQKEIESYRSQMMDYERKQSENMKKLLNYEENLSQLNRKNESLKFEKQEEHYNTQLNKIKELNELKKEIDNLENLIKGYQKENEILISKENMNKKEVEKLNNELKIELKRNQQLQSQLLRQNSQVLVTDDSSLDLNKSNIHNLIIGGEAISVYDLKDLKSKNKNLNETNIHLINENKSYKMKEGEYNEMITNYKYRIEELELKLEGIDVDKFKKDNDIINNMTKEFKNKESQLNMKVKDLENKLKF